MPPFSPDALRKQVQKRRLSELYLLYGEDVRTMEQSVDAIESVVDPADRAFAVERVYAGEAHGSPVDIVAAASVLPMLGDRRIVTVLRAERFLKPARASKAVEIDDQGEAEADNVEPGPADLSALEAYLKKPSESSTLVFVAAGIDRNRRFTKQLLAAADWIEFAGLSGDNAAQKREARSKAVAEIKREIEAAGRTIETATAQLLVDRAGGDISKLRDDVERLLLYTEGQPKVARSDVEEVVSVESDVDDWALVNAIGDGDAARALRELGLRLDRGDPPFPLLGQLRWWVSQRLSASAPERVKPALDALLRTDLGLKSSGGEPRILLERLVVELTGRPLPRPAWGPGRR